jgi:2,3-bisphosphoglycerate-independent phosphoglycerate mutase
VDFRPANVYVQCSLFEEYLLIKAKTAHTLNPVPFVLYDNVSGGKLSFKNLPNAGLSNIAATTANLLGFEKHESWDESLLVVG